MEVERLGKVMVGDGAYARELQQRAIQEEMTVMVTKTIEKNEKHDEIISFSGPRDTRMTRLYQRRILRVNVNKAVAEGESVMMIFSRSDHEI